MLGSQLTADLKAQGEGVQPSCRAGSRPDHHQVAAGVCTTNSSRAAALFAAAPHCRHKREMWAQRNRAFPGGLAGTQLKLI